MELKGKDTYKIECLFTINQEAINSLMMCYQACIGATAVSLYLTLISEATEQRGSESHQRICTLMGVDIVAFEHARQLLEEYNLVQTYIQSLDSKDSYIYILKAPYLVNDFINHAVYGRRYLQVVGTKVIEGTKAKVIKPLYDKSSYKNVSKKFNSQILQSWDSEDEVKYSKVKPTYTINQAIESHIKFDYARFLQESTNLSFPVEARTKEALQLIGELATIYGITIDRMRIIVGHCINNSTNVLDMGKLKALASYEKPEVKKAKNQYDISPVLFLQNYQDGIEVSRSDAKILEELISKFKLNQEVVNVMIETVLKRNNNRLNTTFIEKIAGSWARNHIHTIEMAKEAAKEIGVRQSTTYRKTSLPDTFNEEVKTTSTVDENKQKELFDKLKRLEEN